MTLSTFEDWAAKHPAAAMDLLGMFESYKTESTDLSRPESAVQGAVRVDLAKQGVKAFRNNVGATPSRCKSCGERRAPVRYGLANDSTRLNKVLKSSDVIGLIPRIITPDMVGKRIAQFGSWEVKPDGWTYSGKGREPAQLAWLTLVRSVGGHADFTTGHLDLTPRI